MSLPKGTKKQLDEDHPTIDSRYFVIDKDEDHPTIDSRYFTIDKDISRHVYRMGLPRYVNVDVNVGL